MARFGEAWDRVERELGSRRDCAPVAQRPAANHCFPQPGLDALDLSARDLPLCCRRSSGREGCNG